MYIDSICQTITCISRLFQMNFQILSSIAIEWKTIFGQTGMKIFWYPPTANGYFECEPCVHFLVRVYATCKIENKLSRPVHPFKQTKHGRRWQGASFFCKMFPLTKRFWFPCPSTVPLSETERCASFHQHGRFPCIFYCMNITWHITII